MAEAEKFTPQDPRDSKPEFIPRFNPDSRLNIQSDLRINLFQAVLKGDPLDKVRECYLKRINKFTLPHNYQAEIQRSYYNAYLEVHGQTPRGPLTNLDREELVNIVKIPHPEDFNKQEALRVMKIDLGVAEAYLERGELEDLIEEEDATRLANGWIFRLVHHFSRTWR